MGIHLDLENFPQLFASTTSTPIIVNDVDMETEEDCNRINDVIYNRFDGDVLSTLPSCNCGKYRGNFLKLRNKFCEVCESHVRVRYDEELESILWIRAPDGVAEILNPTVWLMLRRRFKTSGFDVLQWLCNTHYNTARNPRDRIRVPPFVERLEIEMRELEIPRNYNSFVENFWRLMEIMFTLKKPKRPWWAAAGRREEIEDPLLTLLKEKSDLLFTPLLPLPNRAILAFESSDITNTIDPLTVGAINAIRIMMGVDVNIYNRSVVEKQNRLVKALSKLADYHDSFSSIYLQKKQGIIRRNLIAGRVNMSFRTVISSHAGRHRYDEIHIPWSVGVAVLREHLRACLMEDPDEHSPATNTAGFFTDRGYSVNQANTLLAEYAQRYHPLLDQLFQHLISTASAGYDLVGRKIPNRGLPVSFQRNPSLERGSAQRLFITRVKTNVHDFTTSLSPLIIRGFNADFDGGCIAVVKLF